ncbi:MAG: excinuclease ABC subunit C, partial [Pseudomonadota bacterium]|nr:excinuclease ABC subunit C [Pseudomonadota bacterium]
PDRFYQPGRKDALVLSKQSPGARLLQQVRDEAHRFAVNYHRLIRKRERDTVLVEIEGIGKKRALRLLQIFGSVEKMLSLSPEELAEKASLPFPVARKVCDFLRQCN